MAAAFFASQRKLQTAVVASTAGGLLFASGVLDLLGIHPIGEQRCWTNPWQGIAALRRDCPKHPYALVADSDLAASWQEFLQFLAQGGLHYQGRTNHNVTLITGFGTLKTTFRVPRTMWPGVLGLLEKKDALIVDFKGMKEFRASQIVENARPVWPSLRAVTLSFPFGFPGAERHNVAMAQALQSPEVLTRLASSIRPLVGQAELIGVPSIVGLQRAEKLLAELAEQVGVPFFEIPAMPPSVPGLRLKETLEGRLTSRGVRFLTGRRAVAVQTRQRHCQSVIVRGEHYEKVLTTRGVLLASGRFLGGGLRAERGRLCEAILGLPVYQPQTREQWHRQRFLDPRGHPINQAGLAVDRFMRPIGCDGHCAYENLFAVGSLLAHQDWMRMKCGAGLALATAYAAVTSFIDSQ